jgi:hypothetical protein
LTKAVGDNPEVSDVWNLLFTDNMVHELALWSDKKVCKIRTKYTTKDISYIQEAYLVGMKGVL